MTWTRTFEEVVSIPAPPPRVFAWLDDPRNTGMHQRKKWQTTGEPRVIILGGFEMSFVLTAVHRGTRLALAISYNLPPRGVGLLRGRVVARPYAQWCVRRMARDAELAMRSAA